MIKRHLTDNERSALMIGAGVSLGVLAFFRMMKEAPAGEETALTNLVSQAFDPTQSLLGGLVFRGAPYGGFRK